jgi:hypothetical protein
MLLILAPSGASDVAADNGFERDQIVSVDQHAPPGESRLKTGRGVFWERCGDEMSSQ